MIRRILMLQLVLVAWSPSIVAGETDIGQTRTAEVRVGPDHAAPGVLSGIAVEAGCPLYVEMINRGKGEKPWFRKALVSKSRVLNAGTLNSTLRRIQALLGDKVRIELRDTVVAAYEAGGSPIAAPALELDFQGNPWDCIMYLISKFRFTTPSELPEVDIGYVKRMRKVGRRTGRIKGRMSLRDALIAYAGSAELNVNAIVESSKDAMIVDVQFTPVPVFVQRRRAGLLKDLATDVKGASASTKEIETDPVEPGPREKKLLLSPERLAPVLARIGRKFNCSFGVEEYWEQGTVMNDLMCRRVRPPRGKSLSAVLEELGRSMPDVRIIHDGLNKNLYHIVEAKLLAGDNYVMSQRMESFDFTGTPRALLKHLSRQGLPIRMTGMMGIPVSYGPELSRDEKHVAAKNVEVRSIIAASLTFERRSFVRMHTYTPDRGDRVTVVEFSLMGRAPDETGTNDGPANRPATPVLPEGSDTEVEAAPAEKKIAQEAPPSGQGMPAENASVRAEESPDPGRPTGLQVRRLWPHIAVAAVVVLGAAWIGLRRRGKAD